MFQRLRVFFDDIAAQPRLPFVYLLPALALCLLLQLQVSLFKTDDYLGLRLSAADIILPFLGLLVGVRLLLKQDSLPQWSLPGTYYGLAALVGIMTYALINGYNATGVWDRWAVINKYAGFFVLIAYLGIGGWIGNRPPHEWHRWISHAFITVWAVIFVGTLSSIVWFDIQNNIDQIRVYYPLSAFMGNRNAYAFLSFCALALFTATQIKRTCAASPLLYLLWALMPLFYVYNASRAGIIILPLLFFIFLVLSPRIAIKAILPALFVGLIFVYGLSGVVSSLVMNMTAWHTQNVGALIDAGLTDGAITPESARERLDYEGDQVRAQTYNDALSVWAQSKLTGGGIGSFRHYQTEAHGQYSDVIDSTPLWLLAETGVIGLIVFSGLFLMALWRIFTKIRAGEDPHGIYLGIFMMLIIFAIMSLVHEFLYTRFVWFFMGLALALPLHKTKSA